MIFSMKAGGNINPASFVKLSTTADGVVLQSGDGEVVYGIAQPGTRRTPYSSLDDGYAAIAGEDVQVFGVGEECYLRLGGTVTRGDRIDPDSSGYGTTVTADQANYGAIALQSGVSGDLVKVLVSPFLQISTGS